MLSDLPKLSEFGNSRAGVQAAVKECISRVATCVCQNLNVKTSRKVISFGLRATNKQNKAKQKQKHIVSVKMQSIFSMER